MLDLPSISPTSLFGSSGISAIAFPPLTATSSATSSATVASSLEIAQSSVEVSSSGRLLLAIAVFQDGLAPLPSRIFDIPDTPEGNPIALTATAQGFVDTFNTLLGSVDTLPRGSATLPGSALADQLVRAANELALQDIGIELQPVAIPEIAGAGFRLRLEQSRLEAALADDAAATAARLTAAVESVRNLTTGFVAQVAGSAVSLANASLLVGGTGPQADLNAIVNVNDVNAALDLPAAASPLPADLLQQLPAATEVNGIPVSGLELALAGAAAGDIVAAGANVTQDVVSTTLLALATSETASDVDLLAGITANSTTGNTTSLAVTVAADAGAAAEADAIALAAAGGSAPGLLPASPVVVTLPAVPAVAVVATPDLDALEASLFLQRLLLDPTFHVTSNLDNPAYAALIAAAHLSDFVAPTPVINADALLADVPGPVSPIAMAHAVAYYSEAAGERTSRIESRA